MFGCVWLVILPCWGDIVLYTACKADSVAMLSSIQLRMHSCQRTCHALPTLPPVLPAPCDAPAHPAPVFADKPWQLIDDIVMHLAEEQGDDTTRSVLLKYKQESQVWMHAWMGWVHARVHWPAAASCGQELRLHCSAMLLHAPERHSQLAFLEPLPNCICPRRSGAS